MEEVLFALIRSEKGFTRFIDDDFFRSRDFRRLEKGIKPDRRLSPWDQLQYELYKEVVNDNKGVNALKEAIVVLNRLGIEIFIRIDVAQFVSYPGKPYIEIVSPEPFKTHGGNYQDGSSKSASFYFTNTPDRIVADFLRFDPSNGLEQVISLVSPSNEAMKGFIEFGRTYNPDSLPNWSII